MKNETGSQKLNLKKQLFKNCLIFVDFWFSDPVNSILNIVKMIHGQICQYSSEDTYYIQVDMNSTVIKADLRIKTNINVKHGQIGSHNSLNGKVSHYSDFEMLL